MDNAAATTLVPWLWPRAAYVHVPFCAHHCGYCDFAIATGQDDQIERQVQDLTNRMNTYVLKQSGIIGGGHTWPGSTPVRASRLGATTSSISATTLMLDFFGAHPRR